MGRGIYPRTPEADYSSFEDLGQHFVRQWIRNNPKDKEFVLMTDNKEVLKAYNLMITRTYDKAPEYLKDNKSRL